MTQPPADLDGIGLLRDLDAAARTALAGRCRWRTWRRQQEIIGRESTTRDVFFVVAGSVRVVNWSHAGREVSFDDIPAGGTFGELAAIDGEPRSASVIALEQTTLAAIPPDVFMDTVLANPAVARRLMERLAGVIRRATERIFDLSVHGAGMRICAELLRLAGGDAGPEGSAVIDPVPIHADIAARVSTTRETVARVLGDLARRGIVVREAETLRIPDLARLADLVEE